MQNLDLYSTHMEYLLEIFKKKGKLKNVVEFGTGNYSTKILIENSENALSIEMQSEDWYEKIVTNFKNNKNWTHELKLGPMSWVDVKFPDFIDLGFVDGHGESRPECINFLMQQKCPVIVTHDTEEPGYGWERVESNDLYNKLTFKKYTNWTTIWSLDIELINFFKDTYND
jgi:hypothetical protein